jgi:hypothetical protein
MGLLALGSLAMQLDAVGEVIPRRSNHLPLRPCQVLTGPLAENIMKRLDRVDVRLWRPEAGAHVSTATWLALRHRIPIQILRRETWDPKYRPKTSDGGTRTIQDEEATRVWNIHTALYYQAGGVPWRLLRDPADYATCYVGVAFFTTPDRSKVHTSVAQVFNERGDGVVVQGGPAARSKEDRRPTSNKVTPRPARAGPEALPPRAR